ncbi:MULTISPECIES: triacylglycerol lipase [Bacillales]|jgi:pimeloyl-ACP methyl ester carboxylesterase|uniref:Alpha/beta hydrolase n=1 Tax=Brevibacillus aydinogluensis TaxID=927786 RepID=A0AA48RIG4_9BACL|nr:MULTISPECIES: alpha/beta hydrolase [Bacillales]REK64475.1 MAG: alpha/beta hydrolase [Brevibacillus sp.]MBR8660561.1 alpha/beta hydrolase [Brevibacillus sp. NL20B1]NNV02643.1 alpha/beta hydrolase [Brevibacillus sp. MCWH]UFJ59934.1 alpha/beta hydrolase [Anoxybacillus sediminis]CAJ1003441.1 Alpha/beta hydrolase [Brevibacillus aydinogluensis]
MSRRFLPALLAPSLALLLAWPSAAAAAPSPTLHDDNPNGKAGDWYTGAIPPNASNDKPVLLFVQGLHSDYTTWTASDDFYTAAYNAGYRTAFVQLPDAEGTGGSMWTNGRILADVIKKVADYYQVPQINVIAHSKGGIDTQAALVYYGAHPYVNVVHQLGTPNKGSELADLAYSDWTWWLAEIIGMRDDAVYSLQTSYMAQFREQTDSRAEARKATTYMGAGTGDDGWFSPTWFAHAILPGSDDGAVSLDSAFGLPYGIRSFTDKGSEKLSHFQLRDASKTWELVRPKLKLASAGWSEAGAAEAEWTDAGSAKKADQADRVPARSKDDATSAIYRGGEVDGEQTERIPLEGGLKNVMIDVMVADEATTVELISPSGKVYRPEDGEAVSDEHGIFGKAMHHVFSIDKPEKGEWTAKINGKRDAYFLLAAVKGGVDLNWQADKQVFKKNDTASLQLETRKGKTKQTSLQQATLRRSGSGKGTELKRLRVNAVSDNEMNIRFQVPSEPGVYNLSFEVTGVDESGAAFTRSVNYNFAVTDDDGEIPLPE